MAVNPFLSLLKSRKFWLLILDTVVSLVLYFAVKYASPAAVEDIKIVILSLQPVFVVIIGAIAYEDAAGVRAEASMYAADLANQPHSKPAE